MRALNRGHTSGRIPLPRASRTRWARSCLRRHKRCVRQGWWSTARPRGPTPPLTPSAPPPITHAGAIGRGGGWRRGPERFERAAVRRRRRAHEVARELPNVLYHGGAMLGTLAPEGGGGEARRQDKRDAQPPADAQRTNRSLRRAVWCAVWCALWCAVWCAVWCAMQCAVWHAMQRTMQCSHSRGVRARGAPCGTWAGSSRGGRRPAGRRGMASRWRRRIGCG